MQRAVDVREELLTSLQVLDSHFCLHSGCVDLQEHDMAPSAFRSDHHVLSKPNLPEPPPATGLGGDADRRIALL
jgi:hypothetical protein